MAKAKILQNTKAKLNYASVVRKWRRNKRNQKIKSLKQVLMLRNQLKYFKIYLYIKNNLSTNLLSNSLLKWPKLKKRNLWRRTQLHG